MGRGVKRGGMRRGGLRAYGSRGAHVSARSLIRKHARRQFDYYGIRFEV